MADVDGEDVRWRPAECPLHEIVVVSDTGMIALIDPYAFRPPTDMEWTDETTIADIIIQSAARRAIVWNMGDGGGRYRMAFRRRLTGEQGHRHVGGSMDAIGGLIGLMPCDGMIDPCMVECAPVTMASCLAVQPTRHAVRIIQTYDRNDRIPDDGRPHVIIEIEPGEGSPNSGIAWLHG